ncbi:MAG: DNA-binding transcriptional regulator [Tannerella sp.]|nr:DNA-binding transcriptional regulator [Tannerella sp.]
MMYGEKGIAEFAKKWNADAIVAQLRDLNIAQLHSLGIPIIVQNYGERHPSVSNLTGNYYDTGVMAAKYFLSRGYRNFAFYGYKNTIWSRERGLGFADEIKRNGYTSKILENKNPDSRAWEYNHERIGKWLLGLPKPVALFACDDFYALQISETCNMYNISVPDDIAILGVDNDELYCNLSNPPLSSIVLDEENGGYRVGKLIHQLCTNKTTKPCNIVIEPLYIESRLSSEKYAISNKYIQKVLKYISEHYKDHISVSDLVKQIPLSRRVLEIKFKEATGTSVYQCIQEYKIDKFVQLLMSTDLTLYEAAYQAGFEDYKNVSRIFRKYKSMSPAEYRKRHKENNLLNHND